MGHLRRYADITVLNPPRFYSYIPGKWMNFYWKDGKDQVGHFYAPYLNIKLTELSLSQLYVRRGTAGDAVDAWTTFQMTLREPGPMPPAFDFTRFLVSSIAFMAHLSEVSVHFDDKRLVKLSKNRGVSKEVPMIEELICVSPNGTMIVESIETTREFKFCCILRIRNNLSVLALTALHIEAEVVGLVYEVDSEANSSNVVLTIFAANVAVHLDEKMKGELRRAIKKNPPSRLRYELIYVGLTVVNHILKMCSYSFSDREGRI
jgi:hypothetical protein